MSFFCHTCGKDFDFQSILGLRESEAREWHNAFHQRKAVAEAIERLTEVADNLRFSDIPKSDEIRECLAKMQRADYIEPPKEKSGKTT